MTTTLDDIMERASQALTSMDYPQCEALCMEALAHARTQGDWAGYSRVVLPLQESRRLRRQAALDGPVRLGTMDHVGGAGKLLVGLSAGCIVVTPPCSTDDAARLVRQAADARQPVEVLYAQPDADGAYWAVHTFHGPLVEAVRPAPPVGLTDGWHTGSAADPTTPAHWFMQASEQLGNAAIAAAHAPLGDVLRVEQLEQALQAVGDHELLHQALADAARAMVPGAEA